MPESITFPQGEQFDRTDPRDVEQRFRELSRERGLFEINAANEMEAADPLQSSLSNREILASMGVNTVDDFTANLIANTAANIAAQRNGDN